MPMSPSMLAESLHAVAVRPAVGIACLALCVSVLLDGSACLSGFPCPGDAAVGFIGAAAAGMTAYACTSSLGKLLFARSERRGVTVALVVLGAISLSTFSVLGAFSLCTELQGIFLGVALGVALGRIGVTWYEAIACLKSAGAFATVGAGMFMAAFARLAMICMPGCFQAITLSLALLGSTAALPRISAAAVPAESPSVSASDLLVDARSLVKDDWLLLMYFAPFVALVAFSWRGTISGETMANNPSAETSWGIASGFLLAACAVWALSLERLRPWSSTVYLSAPTMCLALLLVSRFIGTFQGGVAQVVTNVPLGFSMAITGALVTLRFSGEEGGGPAFPFFVRLIAGVHAAGFLVCFSIWPFMGDELADGLCTSAFILCMAASFLHVVRGRSDGVSAASGIALDSVDSAVDVVEARVKVLARQFCLSPRETEVMSLLAQGYTTMYIAERQFISNNTVRTHAKRIYQKMGVSSKQELLEIVHRAENEPGHSD